MHPIHWIYDNREWLQPLANFAIAFFTVILIAVTAVYAWANWRTVHVLEADLKQRTRPFPTIERKHGPASDTQGNFIFTFSISCTNAPMLLEKLRLLFLLEDDEEAQGSETLLTPRPVTVDESILFSIKVPMSNKGIKHQSLYLTYYNASTSYKYETVWSPDSLRTKEIT